MRRILMSIAVCIAWAAPAAAEPHVPVSDKATFLRIVGGSELWLGLFRVKLRLTPDGGISGSALGWGITGTWEWRDGYFCRKMDWSGTAIPANCQLVEARGTRELRFTSDRGEGQAASFTLR